MEVWTKFERNKAKKYFYCHLNRKFKYTRLSYLQINRTQPLVNDKNIFLNSRMYKTKLETFFTIKIIYFNYDPTNPEVILNNTYCRCLQNCRALFQLLLREKVFQFLYYMATFISIGPITKSCALIGWKSVQ